MVGLDNGVWTRCFKNPIEVHHRLTRARGGAVLDEYGETHHLIALCPDHHRMADGADAYLSGLLLDGQMIRDGGTHFYTGTDTYLRARYGARHAERSRQ
jgi:hypothetical protein